MTHDLKFSQRPTRLLYVDIMAPVACRHLSAYYWAHIEIDLHFPRVCDCSAIGRWSLRFWLLD